MDDVRVGVDVGGTFTDVVAIHDGELVVTKTPSTPTTSEEGVFDGLGGNADTAGYRFEDVVALSHGTTVATNAVLEREFAETALVTTAGFRDVLEIGRQARPDLYDLSAEKPAPIVPRNLRFEVTERLDEYGRVETPLSDGSIEEVSNALAAADVESVAVCLLFSYENDAHERRVRELIGEEIDASISLSSRVLPEIREYERTMATALNAALRPVMDRYLGRFEDGISRRGTNAPAQIMASNGGLVGVEESRMRPILTVLSGPAAGVRGASYVADRCGIEDVLTMDMGGTSCDVSLVSDGEPTVTTEGSVGDYPLSVPTVDVHTIGAGGGSIAWIDDGGALRVGPRSAGADPGPVSYGRGGDEPTVTDAHVVLGRLDPGRFLEGLDPDRERVEEIVRSNLAEPLDRSVEEAAQGIVDVANANMERALRVVSVERGHDPREFGLVAFGGAGPLHAAELAAALEVPRVIVPRAAGALSALGLLAADRLHAFGTSRVRPWEGADLDELAALFSRFEKSGRERLADEGHDGRVAVDQSLELRYAGQSFSLRVPIDDIDPDAIAERFHERHERRYGYAAPDEPIELVTVRLRVRGLVEPPPLRPAERDGSIDEAVRERRPVRFGASPSETPIYRRSLLPAGGAIDGPAIVEGEESTIAVPPEQSARVDGHGNVIIEQKDDEGTDPGDGR